MSNAEPILSPVLAYGALRGMGLTKTPFSFFIQKSVFTIGIAKSTKEAGNFGFDMDLNHPLIGSLEAKSILETTSKGVQIGTIYFKENEWRLESLHDSIYIYEDGITLELRSKSTSHDAKLDTVKDTHVLQHGSTLTFCNDVTCTFLLPVGLDVSTENSASDLIQKTHTMRQIWNFSMCPEKNELLSEYEAAHHLASFPLYEYPTSKSAMDLNNVAQKSTAYLAKSPIVSPAKKSKASSRIVPRTHDVITMSKVSSNLHEAIKAKVKTGTNQWKVEAKKKSASKSKRHDTTKMYVTKSTQSKHPGSTLQCGERVSINRIIAAVLLEKGRASLRHIYRFVEEHTNVSSLNTGWKNSIRHTLSMNEAFMSTSRAASDGPGTGKMWNIVPKYEEKLNSNEFMQPRVPRSWWKNMKETEGRIH